VILKKTAILLAGVLTGASLLVPAAARATPAGGLSLSSAGGMLTDNPVASYRSARACPADHHGSARVFLYDGAGKAVGALSESFTPTATPPSGALDVNTLAATLAGRPTGDYQLVLGCFDAAFSSMALPDSVWIHVDIAAGTWHVVPPPAAPVSSSPVPSLSATPSGSTAPRSSATATATPGLARVDPRPATIDPSVPAADGTFTFSVDPDPVVMSQASGDGTFLTSTGALSPVTVTDGRTVSKPGWSVTAQVGDFTGGGNTIDGTGLGWTPLITSGGTGVTVGPAVAPGSKPGLGQSAVLAEAPAGQGTGTTQLSAGLTLLVPPDTPAGSYTAVLTLTAMESPS